MLNIKKNISPKKAAAILLQEGLRVNEQQAEYVLNYLYGLAISSLKNVKS